MYTICTVVRTQDRLAAGSLCLHGHAVIRQCLMESSVSRLVSRYGRGKLETLLSHQSDQLGYRLPFQGELSRKMITHIGLSQGADGLVKIAQKGLRLGIEGEGKVAAALPELPLQTIDIVAQLRNRAEIDPTIEIPLGALPPGPAS